MKSVGVIWDRSWVMTMVVFDRRRTLIASKTRTRVVASRADVASSNAYAQSIHRLWGENLITLTKNQNSWVP